MCMHLLWSNYDVSKSGHVMLPKKKKKSGHVWTKNLGRSVGILLQLAPDCQLSRDARVRFVVTLDHSIYDSIKHFLVGSAHMITPKRVSHNSRPRLLPFRLFKKKKFMSKEQSKSIPATAKFDWWPFILTVFFAGLFISWKWLIVLA